MIGRVVSNKMQKTAAVLVERQAVHPLYKKTFVRSKKYLTEDQIGVKEGDIVEIIKIRPISKKKHWKIVKVLGRSLAEIAKQLKEKAEEVILEVMPKKSSENSENLDGTLSTVESSGKKLRKGKRGGKSHGSA